MSFSVLEVLANEFAEVFEGRCVCVIECSGGVSKCVCRGVGAGVIHPNSLVSMLTREAQEA